MKTCLTYILTLPIIITFGQDTTYYYYNSYGYKVVCPVKVASIYDVIQYNPVDSNSVTKRTYYKSGQIKEERNYSVYKYNKLGGKLKEWNENGQLLKDIDYKDGEFNGKLKEWYGNGQLRRDIDYKDGKLNGYLLLYWDNGKPKRIDNYEDNKLIQGKCFDSEGKETKYYNCEKMPEFSGGTNELMNYIAKEIKYPKKIKRKGIEGLVVVCFIVDKDGSISDVKIIKSVNNKLDKEAIRVVKKMPKWEPGMQDGDAIRVQLNLPINYHLK